MPIVTESATGWIEGNLLPNVELIIALTEERAETFHFERTTAREIERRIIAIRGALPETGIVNMFLHEQLRKIDMELVKLLTQTTNILNNNIQPNGETLPEMLRIFVAQEGGMKFEKPRTEEEDRNF